MGWRIAGALTRASGSGRVRGWSRRWWGVDTRVEDGVINTGSKGGKGSVEEVRVLLAAGDEAGRGGRRGRRK